VRDAALLTAAAVAVVAGYLPRAVDGHTWSIAILAVAVLTCVAVGWSPARRAEAASARVPEPQPDLVDTR
jgi:hypothetical protein